MPYTRHALYVVQDMSYTRYHSVARILLYMHARFLTFADLKTQLRNEVGVRSLVNNHGNAAPSLHIAWWAALCRKRERFQTSGQIINRLSTYHSHS